MAILTASHGSGPPISVERQAEIAAPGVLQCTACPTGHGSPAAVSDFSSQRQLRLSAPQQNNIRLALIFATLLPTHLSVRSTLPNRLFCFLPSYLTSPSSGLCWLRSTMFKLMIATVLSQSMFSGFSPSVISRNLLILEIREVSTCVDSKWSRGATPLIIHCVPATVLAASRNQTQVILREERTLFLLQCWRLNEYSKAEGIHECTC